MTRTGGRAWRPSAGLLAGLSAGGSNERNGPAGLLYVRLEDVPSRDGDRLVASAEDQDFFWHDTTRPADPPRYRGARAYVHIPETARERG